MEANSHKLQDNSIVIKTDSYTSYLSNISKDLYFLERIHNWSKDTVSREVFSEGWKLFLLDNEPFPICIQGKKEFALGAQPTTLFLPAFEPIEWHLKAGTLKWKAYISAAPLKFKPPGAIAFSWNKKWKIESIEDIDNILLNLKSFDVVNRQASDCKVASTTKWFLDNHYMLNLSLKEVAANLDLPYSTMTHYFRRSFAMSPSEYRQHLRVTAAGSLLAKGKKSATESCFETGHGDYSSFKEGFKKVFGVTPRQFYWQHNTEGSSYQSPVNKDVHL